MKFEKWQFRIVILGYIIYKMLLSSPLPSFSSIFRLEELNQKTGGGYAGHITGTIIVITLFSFLFGTFFFYHIKQGISEFKNEKVYLKRRFRLISILFTSIFFLVAGLSLFNTGSQDITILLKLNSWLDFYTIFTLVSTMTAFFIVFSDIKIYRMSKKVRTHHDKTYE